MNIASSHLVNIASSRLVSKRMFNAPVVINKDKLESYETKGSQPEKKSMEDRKNPTVIAIFDWMRPKGRVINIAKESLTKDFVDSPPPESENLASNADWVNEDEPARYRQRRSYHLQSYVCPRYRQRRVYHR